MTTLMFIALVLLLLLKVQAWDSSTLLFYGGLIEDLYDQSSTEYISQQGDYTVTQKLYTTEDGGSVWIGYVAISNSKQDIAVVFRGTLHPAEWCKNIEVAQVPFIYLNGSTENSPNVHGGFFSLYTDSNSGDASLRQQLTEEISRLLSSNNGYSVTVVGHSLGGALSILSAFDIATSDLVNNGVVSLSIYTFAAPMVGDDKFKQMVEGMEILDNILRVSDIRDVVPYLPSLDYEHAGEELDVDGCKFSYPGDGEATTFFDKVSNYHSMKRYLNTVGSMGSSTNTATKDYVLPYGLADDIGQFVKDIISAASNFANDIGTLASALRQYASNFSKPCQS